MFFLFILYTSNKGYSYNSVVFHIYLHIGNRMYYSIMGRIRSCVFFVFLFIRMMSYYSLLARNRREESWKCMKHGLHDLNNILIYFYVCKYSYRGKTIFPKGKLEGAILYKTIDNKSVKWMRVSVGGGLFWGNLMNFNNNWSRGVSDKIWYANFF